MTMHLDIHVGLRQGLEPNVVGRAVMFNGTRVMNANENLTAGGRLLQMLAPELNLNVHATTGLPAVAAGLRSGAPRTVTAPLADGRPVTLARRHRGGADGEVG